MIDVEVDALSGTVSITKKRRAPIGFWLKSTAEQKAEELGARNLLKKLQKRIINACGICGLSNMVAGDWVYCMARDDTAQVAHFLCVSPLALTPDQLAAYAEQEAIEAKAAQEHVQELGLESAVQILKKQVDEQEEQIKTIALKLQSLEILCASIACPQLSSPMLDATMIPTASHAQL